VRHHQTAVLKEGEFRGFDQRLEGVLPQGHLTAQEFQGSSKQELVLHDLQEQQGLRFQRKDLI
jgi:hypothetical protein